MKPDTFNLYIRATSNPNKFGVAVDDPRSGMEEVDFLPDDAFNNALLRLHARGPDAVFTDIPSQNAASALVGETLFRSFINNFTTAQVLNRFDHFLAEHDAQHPQRIALHLPRALYRLPWEVLRNPADPFGYFLSLFHSVVRIDGEAQGPDPRYLRVPATEPTLQLLFVLSSPSNRSIGEFEAVETGEVKFCPVKPATYDNFQKFTGKTDIKPDGFVFLGHGTIEQNHGALVFCKWLYLHNGQFRTTTSDPRPGFTVSSDLARRNGLRFGCLLACESAWINDEFPFENSVVGSILRGSKIPFVLGAQTPISLYAAQVFLFGIVDALQNKEPLDFAVTAGRQKVHALTSELGTYPALDWWVPVLYSKTTSFDLVSELPVVRIPESTRTF